MNWYPDRLLIANVAGRALLSGSYIIGELRIDPWRGFDIPEGEYKRLKGHQYEELVIHTAQDCPEVRPCEGCKSRTPRRVATTFRKMLADHPVPTSRAQRWGVLERQSKPGEPTTRFSQFKGVEGMIHVDPRLLDALVHLIDGEPDAWFGSDQSRPVHAVSSSGHWHGAIMPVRVS